MSIKRHNNKWSIHEILSLQREYELLEMSVGEIANKHQRSEEAILWKLEKEGFSPPITHSKEISKKTERKEEKKEKDLNVRILNLENSISDMKLMVKEVVDNFMEQKRIKSNPNPNPKKSKRKPLRIAPYSYTYAYF